MAEPTLSPKPEDHETVPMMSLEVFDSRRGESQNIEDTSHEEQPPRAPTPTATRPGHQETAANPDEHMVIEPEQNEAFHDTVEALPNDDAFDRLDDFAGVENPNDALTGDFAFDSTEQSNHHTDFRPATDRNTQNEFDLGSSVLGNGSSRSKEQGLMVQQMLMKKFQQKNRAGASVAATQDDRNLSRADSPFDSAAQDQFDALTSDEETESDFETAKTVYLLKKRANTNTIEDDVTFMSREAKEKARIRKRQADINFDRSPTPSMYDDESTLFVSNAPSAIFGDDEDDDRPAPTRRGRKRKAPAASEATEQPRARPNRAQKKAADASKRKSAKPKKATKANARKNDGRHNTTNLNSIMGADIFADTLRTAHLQDQPKVQVMAHRQDVMKTLVSSLPAEDRRVATSDKRLLDSAIKDLTGQGCVKPADDGNWSMKGMKSTLKHYQIIGVAFMRRRENGEHEPKGGILADQMGLGKTVTMLANIMNGKPLEKSRRRATLIVAAPAIIRQWREEIGKHCQSRRESKKYGITLFSDFRSGSSEMSDLLIDQIEQSDIILASYYEVCKSYPKAEVPIELVTKEQKENWWKEYYEQSKGVLHHVNFHRVVLDEAHCIKNHLSHTSMACRAIQAKHRWAITGTPVMNGVKEFYAYFRFLREPHTASMKIFKENFCDPDDPDRLDKLNAFLQELMIRRTHIDTMFNARLLDLPTPQELTLTMEFNQVEREIYEIVKKRMVARINTMAKNTDPDKPVSQQSNIWTMILRLRQICAHPLLIQETVADILEREDFEKLNKLATHEDAMGNESGLLLLHLRKIIASNAGDRTVNPGLGNAVNTTSAAHKNGMFEIDEDEPVEVGMMHGTNYRFKRYLDSFMESKQFDAIVERSKCSSCSQKPFEPMVTSCSHIYCAVCIQDLQTYYARAGYDQAKCSECYEEFTSVNPVQTPESQSTRSPAELGSSPGATTTKKGKKKNDDGPDDMKNWISMGGEVLPSTKTRACKAQLLEWFKQDPNCKVIIYTQFLDVVRIMAKVCQTERWKFVKYTGQMSHTAREKAIQEFADDKPENPGQRVQIMLASLKSGGLGLNLTMASRVICIDPWWNKAVEQQAFCRVFRIGQTKETRMTRLVIKNSMDEAMMTMKERKQMEIDEVMDSDSSKRRFTFRESMGLFGQVGEDAQGKPFIFAEPQENGCPRYVEIDSDDEDGHMGNEA